MEPNVPQLHGSPRSRKFFFPSERMMGRQRASSAVIIGSFAERIRQVIFKGNIPGALLPLVLRLEMIKI